MAFTTGNKTMTTSSGETLTITIDRIIAAQPNGNGVPSAIYKHTNGSGSPRQEMSMSETIFNEQGWTDA